MKATVGIVDDHQLFVKSISQLINSFTSFEVVIDARNGKELLEKLPINKIQPDILLIDVNMPVMDGTETVENITKNYPRIKAVALSMKDDDMTVIKMIRAGCFAYLLKYIPADEFERALSEISEKGYYNADAYNIHSRRLFRIALGPVRKNTLILPEGEKVFLQLACSDLNYIQIAAEMHLAERTIDGYREALFEKLNVRSRVGMVLEAVRRGLVVIERDMI